jgi:hypothetical protein
VKFLAGFLVLIAVMGIFGAIIGGSNRTSSVQSAPSPAQQAAKQKDDAAFARAVAGAKQLHDSMRNPESFRLGQTLIMADGTVCYDYRAQNGFGGMNVGHAVLAPNGQFKSDESDGFDALWNKRCAGKTGDDKTWEVGYAAGFHGMFDK